MSYPRGCCQGQHQQAAWLHQSARCNTHSTAQSSSARTLYLPLKAPGLVLKRTPPCWEILAQKPWPLRRPDPFASLWGCTQAFHCSTHLASKKGGQEPREGQQGAVTCMVAAHREALAGWCRRMISMPAAGKRASRQEQSKHTAAQPSRRLPVGSHAVVKYECVVTLASVLGPITGGTGGCRQQGDVNQLGASSVPGSRSSLLPTH
jgi:hypothetical protein